MTGTLLAVLPDDAKEDDLDLVPLWNRLRDLHAQRVELIPITVSEFDRWRDSLGSLPQIVSSEGVVVYDRQDTDDRSSRHRGVPRRRRR